MLSRIIAAEIKWIILAFVIALVLVSSVNGILVTEEYSGMVKPTFFGLNLFMEILVFFVFSTFVVFGIKGFFEMYSQRVANVIIIMGRKTFESLPGRLPNRTHIIVTRQKEYRPEGCLIANSLEQAVQMAPKDQDVYIIGGGEIYKQAMPMADKLEITRVEALVDADAFFPEIGPEWQLAQKEEHPGDDRHAWAFAFETYVKY